MAILGEYKSRHTLPWVRPCSSYAEGSLLTADPVHRGVAPDKKARQSNTECMSGINRFIFIVVTCVLTVATTATVSTSHHVLVQVNLGQLVPPVEENGTSGDEWHRFFNDPVTQPTVSKNTPGNSKHLSSQPGQITSSFLHLPDDSRQKSNGGPFTLTNRC